MQDPPACLKYFSKAAVQSSLAILAVLSLLACGDASGPAVAMTLTLSAVDGNLLPAAVKGADGRTITIGIGRLQGTDIGPSCGMSIQLTTGPIASVAVPNCKLVAGDEITFTATLNDSRFPMGPHSYRFVPP